MSGNGYQAGLNAANLGRPMPQSNNWYEQQNIIKGYNAGNKK